MQQARDVIWSRLACLQAEKDLWKGRNRPMIPQRTQKCISANVVPFYIVYETFVYEGIPRHSMIPKRTQKCISANVVPFYTVFDILSYEGIPSQ